MSNNQMQFGQICWSELLTNEPKKAQEFYGSLFGWKFQDHQFDGITYTTVTAGDKDFGGMMQIPQDKKDQIPAHWLNYILVENVETMLNKAKNAGAKVCVEPTQVSDFGRFAVVIDPTGAAIAFWQMLKTCD